MFQTDQSSASPTLPTPATAGTQGFFTNGNPATGVAATIVDADWLNMIQEELVNIVIAGGETPSKTTYNQVLQAILAIGKQSNILTDTGAANAYAAANGIPLTATTLVHGIRQRVQFAHANTGASTYAPDGLPPKPIYGLAVQALQGSEIAANGVGDLIYFVNSAVNSGNGAWIMLQCTGGALQIAPATAPQHALQLQQATGRLLNIQTFNSSGTYTPTAGTTHCRVTVVGGGASGGGAAATQSAQVAYAGGGGGGGVATGYYPVSSLSGQTVTVGAGGSPSASNGNSGGTSAVGVVLSASGGSGGASAYAATPPAISAAGSGGVGTGGNIFNGKGSPGTQGLGIAVSNANAGAGGGSTLSLGVTGPISGTYAGNAGTGPGCGGSGSSSQNGGAAQASGAGAAGVVIIEEFA